MNAYRRWFYAAAIYNVIWGGIVTVFPSWPFRLTGQPEPNYPMLFQGVGMMVAVYGLAYYYLGRDPERYANLVWVGILGKVFGPIGFAWALLTGRMALALFWPFMFNDIIWLPAFISFALRYARDPLLLKKK